MKMKPMWKRCMIVFGLTAMGPFAYVGADTKPGVSPERAVPPEKTFQVLFGPVEFVEFTALEGRDIRDEGAGMLEALASVALSGEGVTLEKGDRLYVGETIESGVIRSTGGISELKDSEGKVTLLSSGQGAVVLNKEGHAIEVEGIALRAEAVAEQIESAARAARDVLTNPGVAFHVEGIAHDAVTSGLAAQAAISCTACAGIAVALCNTIQGGCVTSLSCGADGSCSFTCGACPKPTEPNE